MKIVDLSILIESDLPSDPPPQRPHITYHTHKETSTQMVDYFKGLISVEDLPEGNGWAIEDVMLTTHSGTHVDAPIHYYPTMENGKRAWSIDEVPLDWFIGNGVKLDFSDKEDGYQISANDIKEYLKKFDYTLKEGDIVLLQTGATKHWGTEKFLTAGPGMTAEATEYLIGNGVKVMGTDGWSWDIPLPLQAKIFEKQRDPKIIWEGHRVGIKHAYCHIEKLTNLESLPFTGYTFMCLPVKIKGGSAGWCRAVAIFNE
ncbi:cyclase family protein [Peptoniphilus sp. GNH]|nr:putative cyclase [Clostridiales bacterium KA00134]UHR02675.1 cyclase family protein [Peptoniphilus sp. GNH]